ncbi:threonine-phosphate decarboxylase [Pseudomaricurvus alkylphenolicus]|uniref:threonine-phosphate decarboxylase CobD n=1 Tax=Pseudomaricurvus alkylphenolicus TaxID=1306991 RepID=UPI001423EC25|nr:threonine-phosphate decarboxylase CobD [Pseudomaricurvus alkylphenolicus]NIB39979.1 threonine-phosphate decarboxylase [Pseudomaricurvus alkylphenolicus]
MLNHGGQLNKAKQLFPRAPQPWLDLSTGIAPWSWPVSEIPNAIWQRLPESDAPLREAAADYYGVDSAKLITVAGSQVAIEGIPQVFDQASVAIPRWGYGEHARHWQRQGHRVHYYDNAAQVETWLQQGRVQYVVVIQPNNPTGACIDEVQLENWRQRLLRNNGYLLLDAAFADVDATTPGLGLQGAPGVLVLRSVGKFFGMAGLRLGFVVADAAVQEILSQRIPLWSVSGPALWAGQRMLQDRAWQQAQRQRITTFRNRLEAVLRTCPALAKALQEASRATLYRGPLFLTVFGDPALLAAIHQGVAEQGIWLRLFQPVDGRSCLRFGLADAEGLARLQHALERLAQD